MPVIPVGIETFGCSRKNRRPCCVVWGEPMTFTDLACNGRGYKWRLAAEAVATGFPTTLPDGMPRRGWPRPREFGRADGPRRVSGLA